MKKRGQTRYATLVYRKGEVVNNDCCNWGHNILVKIDGVRCLEFTRSMALRRKEIFVLKTDSVVKFGFYARYDENGG